MSKEIIQFIPCTESTSGGSLQGHIQASFAELVEMFGEPAFEGKGDKITTEFVIDYEVSATDGDSHERGSFCLYDWRYSRDFNDDYKVITWNVGGKSFSDSFYASVGKEIYDTTDVRYEDDTAVLCHAKWHDVPEKVSA